MSRAAVLSSSADSSADSGSDLNI